MLAGCVQDYFGWQLLDFKPSTRGDLGSFRGKGPSYHSSNPNPGNQQELTITNNAASYTKSYLKYKAVELGSPIQPKYDVYGLSVGSNLTNWTGNDVPTGMDILMTQVHELGHTLDALTQIGYDDEKKHPDRPDLGGKILENCVKSRGGFKYQ